MFVRSIVLCLYLALLYGISHQSDELRMVFFPTLGAFGFLFLVRSWKEMLTIVIAAVLAVTVGNALFVFSPGVVSFFVTALMVIVIIQKLRLNAAPVVAVSFIPFFAHPTGMWVVPVSVLVALGGLLVITVAAQRLEAVGRAFARSLAEGKIKQMDAAE